MTKKPAPVSPPVQSPQDSVARARDTTVKALRALAEANYPVTITVTLESRAALDAFIEYIESYPRPVWMG